MSDTQNIPRAIEVGFPIVEINRLAVPERNSFKPIYQMHKWFARRASCVFRAILLGALKPAFKPDGTPTDLMEEFYKDHTNDPDTKGKHILDPFMGGGTTVVEALRLGCHVTGIDINPVAWFIVKTEVEPVDLDELQEAFERLAARPVDWNDNKPLRETLLGLYKTEVVPGVEADVIYTFWVKHAICTDPNCRREVPLFKDYIIARKSPSVRYFRDVTCPHCGQAYDWDIENVSLIIDPTMMVNAPKGSSGTGRPVSKWSYAPLEVRQNNMPKVECPHCHKLGAPRVKSKKNERKKVPYTVMLCPECEAVWQWRGDLPEGEMTCPACSHVYDPHKGSVPRKGKFLCPFCGNRDKIIESIRRLPQDQRLPIRPYALEAYLPAEVDNEEQSGQKQDNFFNTISEQRQNPASNNNPLNNDMRAELIKVLPKNCKFFMRFSASDKARLQQAERLWELNKDRVPYPKSKIPVGEKTKSGLLSHHYNYWHEMFAPRQLLSLSTLFKGILADRDKSLQEMMLCAFSDCVARNNLFCRYFNDRNTIQEIFSRHDYQPKSTIAEGSVFGNKRVRGTYPQMFGRLLEGKGFNDKAFDWYYDTSRKRKEGYKDTIVDGANAALNCSNSSNRLPADPVNIKCVITDPPYVGNVNYAELSDFFYVWLRLALKDLYPHFAPEYVPKAEEIIENRTRKTCLMI
ncbi:MAG: DUF1156 domain-containing protein [Deltaproteobacteria bacterium]|nr:DUF1156 domain-containing protein [Deltaproteobacteria bacterium]MBW1795591.1 DUF1156 domain-containing protein [Deltaproteobacteria bacterium]MBW2117203.1 DUF1156 domain-containing protein [Deltaproteobacteria bacterium]